MIQPPEPALENVQLACLAKDTSSLSDVEWLTTREHVRRRPDMYIGSVVPVEIRGVTFRLASKPSPAEEGALEEGALEGAVGEPAPTSTGAADEHVPDDSTHEPFPASKKLKVAPKRRVSKVTLSDVERVDFAVSAVSPALLKLLDEMVVNALDNGLRDASQKTVRIGVDRVTGALEVYNDGAGLEPIKYAGTDRHTISVIFGEYMSGTNLGVSGQETFAGGRNGYGISLVNTFSKRFTVETSCVATHTTFRQEWTNNMETEHPPTVRPFRGATGFVRVTSEPDWALLGMTCPGAEGVPQDVMMALSRRVWDAAACSALRPMRVCWSDGGGTWSPPLPIAGGVDLVRALTGAVARGSRVVAHDTVCREQDGLVVLDVAVSVVTIDEGDLLDAQESRVVAYVNGIRCSTGSHVRHVTDRLVEMVRERVRTKSKRGDDLSIKPQQVLQHLTLCVTCLVAEKQFESQAKECLTTPAKSLGFTWKPSDKFRAALLDRTDIVDKVLQGVTSRDQVAAHRATSRQGVARIAKYDPPAASKTRGRRPCLLVAEGDSAKEFLVEGVSAVGREHFGLYALKGKPLNTRNNAAKMQDNREINELSRILGLRPGTEYTPQSVAALPFEHMVIVADQDVDGAHIGGLLMNWIEASHPSLLKVKPDFIQRFFTGLIRASPSRGESQLFYSSAEFAAWAEARGGDTALLREGWRFKYYKGLGTSTSAEARQYFTNYDQHILSLVHGGDGCTDAMSRFFDGKRASARKAMLEQYDPSRQLDYRAGTSSYENVVTTELTHFAFYDTHRSIPGFDGLKPVQRKALCYFLDKRVTEQVKVAQAGASAASYSRYHHGEASIIEAIVGMAQEFVGTNNVPMLLPIGQFGSRNNKPSTHAAPRYIFTALNEPVAGKLFRREDDPVLQRVYDEGHRAEPELYVGVVPLALINPTMGIGTGFSTFLPPYDPTIIVAMCRALAECEMTTLEETLVVMRDPLRSPLQPLVPHYDGFNGPQDVSEGSLHTMGMWTLSEHSIVITELPVGTWVEPYLEFVRTKLMSPHKDGRAPLVLDLFNGSSGTRVHLELTCDPAQLASVDIVPTFKLRSSHSLNNMWIFGSDKQLQKIEDPRDLLREHAVLRIQTYELRRMHQIHEQEAATSRATDVLRFVEMVMHGEIELRARPMAELEAELELHAFKRGDDGDYGHLLRLPLSSITAERAGRLRTELDKLHVETQRLRALTPCSMWITELDELAEALGAYQVAKLERNSGGGTTTAKKPTKPARKPRVAVAKRKRKDDGDSARVPL